MGKMVMKQCPQCDQHVPVACKSCPCGHMYFQARRPVNGQKPTDPNIGALGAVKKRRGEQLRQLKNVTKETNDGNLNRSKTQRTVPRARSANSTSNSVEDGESMVEETLKRKRGRQKLNTATAREAAKEKVKEKDMYANIPPEQAAKYSVILSEINRKMGIPSFTV